MASMTDWLFSGKLVQFPNLKLAYSEGQIGWIPYVLERADDGVGGAPGVGRRAATSSPSRRAPTTTARSTAASSATGTGSTSLDEVGVDNITFETDYPHTDSTWPDTKPVADEMFAGLDDDAVRKIVRGNAIRMLQLDLDP